MATVENLYPNPLIHPSNQDSCVWNRDVRSTVKLNYLSKDDLTSLRMISLLDHLTLSYLPGFRNFSSPVAAADGCQQRFACQYDDHRSHSVPADDPNYCY